MEITRRQFGKYVAGILATAGTFIVNCESEKQSYRPENIFIDLGREYATPKSVVHKFARASTPVLMASYTVFYPEMFKRIGFKSLGDLRLACEDEKKTYPHDHHRLDVLPAVFAAHLLKIKKRKDEKEILCHEIIKGLSDKRREAKEIILQNLITAVSPNVDSLRFFSLNQKLLKKIEDIIIEAKSNPKLLVSASLCTQFLLNARAVLIASKTKNIISLQSYEKLLTNLQESKASHFWHLSEIVKLHKATFKANQTNVKSLPPQSTEALLGWGNLPLAQDYLSQLALTYARQTYVNYQTANGSICSDEIMTPEQAKRALGKSIGFWKNFNLGELLNTSTSVSNLPIEEKEFKSFLEKDFGQLVAHPERAGINVKSLQPSKEEILLKRCVPFAQFSDYGLLNKLAYARDAEERKQGWKILGTGLTSLGTGYAAYKGSGALFALLKKLFGFDDRKLIKDKKDFCDNAMHQIEKIDKDIETGKYIGIDEQQEELGGIPLEKEA